MGQTTNAAGPRLSTDPDPIAQALACYDTAYTNRRSAERQAPRTKFKPLVLKAVPSARVRRIGGTYECFIEGAHVQCKGEHSTPDRAWLCLARFVAAGASK